MRHYYNLVLYVDDWLEPILTRSYSTEDLRTYTVENIDIFDFQIYRVIPSMSKER